MPLRTRTQGSLVNDKTKYTTTTFAGASSVSYLDVGSILGIGKFQRTTDVATSGYASRVARGQIINNPFRSIIEEQTYSWPGHRIRTNSGSGSTIKYRDYEHFYADLSGFFGSQWGNLDSLGDALREACTEAASKVDSTDVDGTVEAAEGRQTIDLFDRRAWNLREQIRKEITYARKRGAVWPVTVPVSVMANNWLRYRYGLAPFLALLNDTIVTGTAIRTRRRTARGTGATSSDWVETTPGGGYYHPSSVWTITGSAEASVRAGILYEYRNFSDKYGFSLDKIPRAFWELAPYSFVVDWFTNAGEFLGSLTPKLAVRRLATWHGYEATISRTLTVSVGPVRSGFSVELDCSSGSSNHVTTVRHRSPGLLAPILRVRENAMSDVLNSRRVVDAFALTSQMFFKLLGRVDANRRLTNRVIRTERRLRRRYR